MKKLAITLVIIAVLLLMWMLAPEAVGQGRGTRSIRLLQEFTLSADEL